MECYYLPDIKLYWKTDSNGLFPTMNFGHGKIKKLCQFKFSILMFFSGTKEQLCGGTTLYIIGLKMRPMNLKVIIEIINILKTVKQFLGY